MCLNRIVSESCDRDSGIHSDTPSYQGVVQRGLRESQYANEGEVPPSVSEVVGLRVGRVGLHARTLTVAETVTRGISVSGVNVKTTQVRLGHSDPRMTLAVYASSPVESAWAAARLEERFFGRAGDALPGGTGGPLAPPPHPQCQLRPQTPPCTRTSRGPSPG